MQNPVYQTEKKPVYLVLSGKCHRIFRCEIDAKLFASEVKGVVYTNYIFKDYLNDTLK